MKKTILSLGILITLQNGASDYVISLDSKHYKESVSVSNYEPPAPAEPVVPVEPITPLENSISEISDPANGLNIENLTDDIWTCSVAGTSTTSSVVPISLNSPQKMNYIISAGMGRMWRHQLRFYGVVNGEEVFLGQMLTSNYCDETQKTKITFPEITTSEIILKTDQYIYIGELDFGYEIN